MGNSSIPPKKIRVNDSTQEVCDSTKKKIPGKRLHGVGGVGG